MNNFKNNHRRNRFRPNSDRNFKKRNGNGHKLNGDFNNSTDTFTAPITGKYHFDAVVTFINYPIDMTYAFTQLSFSNLTTEIYFDGAVFDEVAGQNIAFTHSILMDMDANDTVQLKYFQQDGTASADISGTSSQLTTYLSGHLVA